MKEIEYVCELSGANEFILKLPKAYDTVVGERGSLLSTGQRQRIAIARALLNHPQLILADEPTGNLDPETSNEIMTLLKQVAFENHAAVVMATHDYHMIQNFPGEAIRCEDGKVTVLNTAELFE